MAWDHRQYVDFINKEAPAAERRILVQAISKSFVPKDPPKRGKPPEIFATYYSMPDWLEIFSTPSKSLASPKVRVDSRLGKVPFSQIIAEYRHAAQKHLDKVAALLSLIDTLPSGKALLAELGSTGHSVRIMPYWHFFLTMPGADYFNSTPIPMKARESMSQVTDAVPQRDDNSAYERNAPIRGDDNNPIPDLGKGTGAGADVVLFFSPEIWESPTASDGPGFKPDEVLFHELTHVTRMIRGRMTRAPVDGTGGYGNIEEYFATVLTNIYMSDKGQTKLRGFYSNDFIKPKRKYVKNGDDTIMIATEALPQDWSVMKDPDKFYDNVDKLSIPPRQLMQILKDKQSDFYFALAHLPEIKPKFNPVGRHFRENLKPPAAPAKGKAPAMSPRRP